MNEMSVSELKQYFENVIALETQILTSERAMDKIRGLCDIKKIELQRLKSPNLKVATLPKKPELEFKEFYGERIEGVSPLSTPVKPGGMPLGFFIGVFIFCSLFSIFAISINQVVCGIFLGIIGLFAGIVFFLQKRDLRLYEKRLSHCIENNKKYDKLYEKEKVRRISRIKELENVYHREMAEYNNAVAETKKVQKEFAKLNNAKAKSFEENAMRAIEKIKDEHSSLKITLDKLYEMDIIFPKYRNIFAICSFYEYLASGRCIALEGHEGAYNLYESELRQDLILTKLDVVISQLEEIKKNQYMLYKEMKEIESTLRSICSQMAKMLDKMDTVIDNTDVIASNTHQIVEFTAVTAMCAQATAKNTEAIKYLTLIN